MKRMTRVLYENSGLNAGGPNGRAEVGKTKPTKPGRDQVAEDFVPIDPCDARATLLTKTRSVRPLHCKGWGERHFADSDEKILRICLGDMTD